MIVGLMMLVAMCLGVAAFVLHFTDRCDCSKERYSTATDDKSKQVAAGYYTSIGPVAPAGSVTPCTSNETDQGCVNTHYGCGHLQGGEFHPCGVN